jgi:hypothetical protein
LGSGKEERKRKQLKNTHPIADFIVRWVRKAVWNKKRPQLLRPFSLSK